MKASVLAAVTLAAAVALAAAPALAQLPAPLQVVPLAGALPGGATTRTELFVTNHSARSATIGVRVMPAAGGAAAAGFALTRTLAPGETARLDAALERDLGRGRGWLLVADATPVDCAAERRPFPAPLTATARLARTGTAGPGVAVPASWLAVNISEQPSRLPPVRAAQAARTWVLVTNVSTVPLTVEVAARALDGVVLAAARRTVPPLGLGAWSLADLGLRLPPGAPAAIEVRRAGESDWDACRVVGAPPPCLDACDRACPGALRLPAFPAFVALLAVADAGGSVQLAQPVIDHVAATATANRYTESHCPDKGGSGRLVDLMTRMLMRRDHSAP